MRYIISISSIFCSIINAAIINTNIYPDSIYVGTTVTIIYSVVNLDTNQYAEFPNIKSDNNQYSILERQLLENKVKYVFQFWESGYQSIPAITVFIKKYNIDLYKIKSSNIDVLVLSTINNKNIIIHPIKPMLEVSLNSKYEKLLIGILIIGLIAAIYIYLHKAKTKIDNKKIIIKKSILNDAIYDIKSLEVPTKITIYDTEIFYLTLSNICRNFIKKKFFIRATEMTTNELEQYFQSIGVKQELINIWVKVNKKADQAKYSGLIIDSDQFNIDKAEFINIIKSFQYSNEGKIN